MAVSRPKRHIRAPYPAGGSDGEKLAWLLDMTRRGLNPNWVAMQIDIAEGRMPDLGGMDKGGND